ncbi:MAG: hypothetical protein O3C40_04340 [Planctomycetota bacterium]|nr:hypothetical protein [Planctomycetota bacterium]
MSGISKRRERRWRAQITLPSVFVIVAAVAAFFACKRAQSVALEKQRIVLEDLKEFEPDASWNSDGIWCLQFRAGARMLDDEHMAKLGALPELWAIDLRETQITDEGLEHVASLPNIRWVVLPRVGITDHGIGELKTRRPDIKVVGFPP